MKMNVGVFDLLDEAYFNHQDLVGIGETDQNIELPRARPQLRGERGGAMMNFSRQEHSPCTSP